MTTTDRQSGLAPACPYATRYFFWLLTASLVLLVRASSSSTSSWTHLQTNRNLARNKLHNQSVLLILRTRHLNSSLLKIFARSSRSQPASKGLASHLHIKITVLHGWAISRNSWVMGFTSPAASPAAYIFHSPHKKISSNAISTGFMTITSNSPQHGLHIKHWHSCWTTPSPIEKKIYPQCFQKL